jgi:hypothetical protein
MIFFIVQRAMLVVLNYRFSKRYIYTIYTLKFDRFPKRGFYHGKKFVFQNVKKVIDLA